MSDDKSLLEKGSIEESKSPDDEEMKKRCTTAKFLANGIGFIVIFLAVYLPIGLVMFQGQLLLPLNLIFIGMGIIGGLFIYMICCNWPVSDIY